MRIGNIKICKKVVRSFALGVGLGALAGVGISYILKTKTNLFDDKDSSDSDCKDVGMDVEPAEFEENAIANSDKKKEDIIKNLMALHEQACKDEEDPEDDDNEDYQIQNIFDSAVDPDEIEAEKFFDENGNEPYPISYKDFSQTCESYTKDTLGYYALDDILTDEKDEIIDDREYWIGENGLELFGTYTDDEDVMYIRNPANEHDYEVIRYTDIHYQEVS